LRGINKITNSQVLDLPKPFPRRGCLITLKFGARRHYVINILPLGEAWRGFVWGCGSILGVGSVP